MGVKLSIVIPCYNEQERVPETLRRVHEYLESRGEEYEVLVVDDGSTDETAARVAALSEADPRLALLSYRSNRGKGYAVRFGMASACGDMVLFTDADLSTPIAELDRLEPYLHEGYDVVIGSRAVAGAHLARRQPWLRERAGRAFNLVIRALGVRGIHDSQCGFKLFSSAAARDIFSQLTIDRWAFDVESLVVARLLRYRIHEVPVTWINSPDSRVNIWRDAYRTVSELVRIRLTWMRRRPVRQAGPSAAGQAPARASLPR